MNETLSRAIAGYKHIDYARTVELATYYEQVATGVGQGELVINYKPRETAQQKAQRVEITQNRTKSPYGKVRGFYRRVFRADKLKFEVKHKDESKASQINEYRSRYGNDGESVLQWAEKTALYYNGIDPNAFYWCKYKLIDGVSSFDPVIFSSAEVFDYKIEKGFTLYAVTNRCETITYLTSKNKDSKTEQVKLYYYFSSEGLQMAISYSADLDRNSDYYNSFRDELGKLPMREPVGGTTYIVVDYPSESKAVAVSRLGYNPDEQTEGRTYVSYWDAASEEFRQLINIGSEYDLTLKLHTFLQKIQYYTACDYRDESHSLCKGGTLKPSGKTCPSCHGTGRKVSTTTQDIILINIPDKDDKDMAIKPSDLVHYVEVPTKILEIQKEIVEEATPKICEAIFGVDISTQSNVATTATEVINHYDTAQDALHDFTKSPRRLWKFTIDFMAQSLDVDDLEHDLLYPSEYNLETEQEILTMLKLAKDAGASPEVIEKLNERLFIKQNRTDSPSMLIYNEMRKFLPFGGIDKELRNQTIIELPYSDVQRALALNFKEITEQIIATKKDQFLISDWVQKKAMIEAEAQKYADAAVASNSVQQIGLLDLDIEE